MNIDRDRLTDHLVRDVSTAPTVQDACRATVSALADQLSGTLAVLLDLGAGRLRCFAAASAWQVFDGVPAEAGVVGRVFRTGAPAVLSDVRADPDYIPLSPGVNNEVCVPIPRSDGSPIGVLNIEYTDGPPTTETAAILTAAANLLAERITALGGIPEPPAGQRLLRHALSLTTAPRESDVLDRTLAAALDVSGLSSAAIVTGTGTGIRVAAARGPLAGLLALTDRNPLALLTTRTRRHGSAYSLGDPAALDARGFEQLTAAGVCTMIAVPIGGRTDEGGVLLAVDEEVHQPDTGTVSLLELLAAQAMVCLERVRLVGQLQQRASSDPLTGLGHHGRFTERLTRARIAKTAILAIDVDQFKTVNDTHGHQEGDRLLVELVRALQASLRGGDELYRIGGDEFAAVVEVAHDGEALAIAERLVRAARGVGRTISVGAAVRQSSESSDTTLRRADAALYAVKRSGRDGARLAGQYIGDTPRVITRPERAGHARPVVN